MVHPVHEQDGCPSAGVGPFQAGRQRGHGRKPARLHAYVHNPPAPVLSHRIDSPGGCAGAEIKGTRQKAPNELRIYTQAPQQFVPASNDSG